MTDVAAETNNGKRGGGIAGWLRKIQVEYGELCRYCREHLEPNQPHSCFDDVNGLVRIFRMVEHVNGIGHIIGAILTAPHFIHFYATWRKQGKPAEFDLVGVVPPAPDDAQKAIEDLRDHALRLAAECELYLTTGNQTTTES